MGSPLQENEESVVLDEDKDCPMVVFYTYIFPKTKESRMQGRTYG